MSKGANDLTELVWHEVCEITREYHLSGGDSILLHDVRRIAISPSGTHRLETADGRKHIVKKDVWHHITILSMGGWGF